MVTIRELANQNAFKGQPNHKIAEPPSVRTLPVIDNSVPTQSNITTSVDTYVSGQYVQRNGNVLEVVQRYTIFVAYSKGTQVQTLNEVRNRIVQDFESKYGKTFNVTNVFIPTIPVPTKEVVPDVAAPGQAAPLELYRGTDLFRSMTRFEKARHEIGTQREMAKTNITSIKKRYRVKR